MKRRPDLPPAARGTAAHHLTAAAARGLLQLPQCVACGSWQYPPREICHRCLGHDLRWQEIDPIGSALALATAHHSLLPYFRARMPRAMATVQLDAGPVVIAHAAPSVTVGGRARVFARVDASGAGVLAARGADDLEGDLPMPDPNREIAGRTVLVTGASGGIGAALVGAFAEAGAAQVLASARDPAGVDVAAPSVTPLSLDVADPASIAAVAAEWSGKLDILVNCAGVNRNSGLLDATDLDGAHDEMTVNYFGPLQLIRAFAPAFKDRRQGVIVNVLTLLSFVNLPLMGSYCASKAAALSLTEGVRAELAPWGIRTMAVFPGAVDTAMSADMPPPKLAPAAVAGATVRAITEGIEDCFVGDMARDLDAQLRNDRKAVERQLAGQLPEPR